MLMLRPRRSCVLEVHPQNPKPASGSHAQLEVTNASKRYDGLLVQIAKSMAQTDLHCSNADVARFNAGHSRIQQVTIWRA